MMPKLEDHGQIYFITDGEAIKIGFSASPRKRLKALQTSHHFPLFLMGSIPATKFEERVVHRRFQHLRVKGEWFWLRPEILDFIETFRAEGSLIPGERIENYNRQFEVGGT